MDLVEIIVKLKLATNFMPLWLNLAEDHVDMEFVRRRTDVNAIKDGLADSVINEVIQPFDMNTSNEFIEIINLYEQIDDYFQGIETAMDNTIDYMEQMPKYTSE